MSGRSSFLFPCAFPALQLTHLAVNPLTHNLVSNLQSPAHMSPREGYSSGKNRQCPHLKGFALPSERQLQRVHEVDHVVTMALGRIQVKGTESMLVWWGPGWGVADRLVSGDIKWGAGHGSGQRRLQTAATVCPTNVSAQSLLWPLGGGDELCCETS